MKITGAQFKEWYMNHFPDGYYVEDLPYYVEDEKGNWVLDDTAVVDTGDLGFLVWSGSEVRETIKVEDAYKTWLNSEGSKIETFAVTVPAELADEVKAYLVEKFGATIV